MNTVHVGGVLFVLGIVLILWGAERFTDGAIRGATLLAVSPFFVGTVISGFEPENLVTGIAAGLGGLHQVALGSVIGATIFMLTAGLGLTLLLVPMNVTIPRAGPAAMTAVLIPFIVVVGTNGGVSRSEGIILLVVGAILLGWLYRHSPVVSGKTDGNDDGAPSAWRAGLLLVAGFVAMTAGGKLVVEGAQRLIAALGVSETVFGMTVVAIGESLEETARMVGPARRGHPELAWGNVVGTVVILVGMNFGIIALVRPLTVDPLVLRLHAPYLIGCTLIVAAALLWAARLGRRFGALMVTLYGLYLLLNVRHLWQ